MESLYRMITSAQIDVKKQPFFWWLVGWIFWPATGIVFSLVLVIVWPMLRLFPLLMKEPKSPVGPTNIRRGGKL